jgi:hypothetical protein
MVYAGIRPFFPAVAGELLDIGDMVEPAGQAGAHAGTRASPGRGAADRM